MFFCANADCTRKKDRKYKLIILFIFCFFFWTLPLCGILQMWTVISIWDAIFQNFKPKCFSLCWQIHQLKIEPQRSFLVEEWCMCYQKYFPWLTHDHQSLCLFFFFPKGQTVHVSLITLGYMLCRLHSENRLVNALLLTTVLISSSICKAWVLTKVHAYILI